MEQNKARLQVKERFLQLGNRDGFFIICWVQGKCYYFQNTSAISSAQHATLDLA